MLMTVLTNTYLALGAFVLAQIADIVTTDAAIRSGRGREANPVIRWAMERTGRAWPLVKLGIAGFSAGLAVHYGGPLWLWPVTGITALVAWSNSRI